MENGVLRVSETVREDIGAARAFVKMTKHN